MTDEQPTTGEQPAYFTEGPPEPEQPAPAPEETKVVRKIDYVANGPRLNASHGDPGVWADEMSEMLMAASGVAFDKSTLEPWFESFRRQVVGLEARAIAFQLANIPISDSLQGDPGFLLLGFRNEMVSIVKRRSA